MISRTRAPVKEVRPCLQRRGPVRQVGAGLRPRRAPGQAGAVAQAAGPVPVLARGDGVGAGPPVPAELVHALGCLAADLADRERWQRVGLAGWVRRVVAEAGRTDLAVHPLVVGQELGVVKGPVVGDSVQGPHLEVGRQESGPVSCIQDRAAADTAVHQRVDVGLRGVHRIVSRACADVRIRVPLLLLDKLPLGFVAREGTGRRPVALFEAHDRESAFRERLDGDRAGGAGPDHQDVRNVGQFAIRLAAGEVCEEVRHGFLHPCCSGRRAPGTGIWGRAPLG